MTKNLKLFGFIALVAVIVFSMAACGSDIDPKTGNTGASDRVVYTGRHNTNDLTLTITEGKTGKAAYAPKINDSYKLVVGENLSSGTVTLIETTDTTVKFTLSASKDGTTFTVTITLSNNRITNISGTVTFDGEGTWNGPGNVNNGSSGGGGGGGGGKSSSGSGSGKTSTGNKLIVMDTATVNSNLESISPDGTLVFDNLGTKDMPVKGDIICSAPSEAAPYGFLYKVKTVTTSGGEIVVATEMATIEEAVEEAEVSQSFDLVFEENEEEEIDGVEVVRNTNSMQRAVYSPFTAIGLNIKKTVNGVTLEGSLELSVAVDCDIKIDWFTLKYFELSTKPRFKADLTASIGKKIEKEIRIPIYNHTFAPITIPVGPVPVVFVPEIFIECIITAEGEVVLSSKLASWDYSFVFGVRSTNGSKLDAFQANTSKPAEYLKDLQLNLNGEVKVEPNVCIMFGLYSSYKIKDVFYAGIGMSGGFYARLAGKSGISIANANVELSLSCGLKFGADADLKIIGIKILGLHKTFYTQEWLIWKKTWSTTTAAAFNSLTANGNANTTTTQLTLAFDKAITGLSASDITLSGVTGVTKGTLSGSGPTYTLPISGFASGGTLSVAVAKSGYSISGSPKTVTIYQYKPPTAVTFNGVTQNGSSTQTTTQLTLAFDKAITGLSASDITLSGVTGASGITKTLSGSGPSYTLAIGNVTSGGTLSVAVAKSGYSISGSPKTATIYYLTPVALNGVTQNGSSTQTTTQLTLTFSQAISGLSASDITLSGVTGASGITKTLSGSGPSYTLAIGNVTSGGTLSVAVAKSGYSISGSPKTVTIFGNGQAIFEYYWVNEHGSLVTTSGGSTTVAMGATLIITAQSAGYVVKQWHLDGENTGQSGNTYSFSSALAGKHVVSLLVEKDGKLYSTNITITVR